MNTVGPETWAFGNLKCVQRAITLARSIHSEVGSRLKEIKTAINRNGFDPRSGGYPRPTSMVTATPHSRPVRYTALLSTPSAGGNTMVELPEGAPGDSCDPIELVSHIECSGCDYIVIGAQ